MVLYIGFYASILPLLNLLGAKDLSEPDFSMYLCPYRYSHYRKMRDSIDKYEGGLEMFSRGYEKFGFNRRYACFLISIACCSCFFF